MEHVGRLLALFELTEQGDSPIRTYSAGQKKKVALCSALVTEAPVLLLDEPFSGGLDPSGLLALKRVFLRHARNKELTIVMTSPVPELVEEIATRVVVLHRGEILAFDTIEGLRRSSGCRGTLGEVLETLLYPETSRRIDDYFQDFGPMMILTRLRVVLPEGDHAGDVHPALFASGGPLRLHGMEARSADGRTEAGSDHSSDGRVGVRWVACRRFPPRFPRRLSRLVGAQSLDEPEATASRPDRPVLGGRLAGGRLCWSWRLSMAR